MSEPDTKNELPALSAAFPTEQEVDETNPWKDDLLERKNIADTLTNLAGNAMTENANGAFVMSVHGEWGTGKTFMLKRLQQQLKNDNRTAIYFNAWEDDFSTDPLTAIIGQLYHSLSDIVDADNWRKQANEFLVLGFSAMKKSLVNHALNYAKLEEGDVSSNAREMLKDYSNSRKQSEEMGKQLCAFADVIKKKTNFPLVFIIDELDRCRPTFALEVLERVKHIFNVPGVVFIFGINKKSLGGSIKVIYGDIDASEYLRRFFHLELNLPPVNSGRFAHSLLNERGVFDFLSKDEFFSESGWTEIMGNAYLTLVQAMGLTLREVEYSLRLIFLVMKGRKRQGGYYDSEGWPVICLVVLKIKLPELYGEFVRGECQSNKVINEMEKIIRDNDAHDAEWVKRMMDTSFYRFAPRAEREGIKKELGDLADNPNVKKDDYLYLSETAKSGGQQYAKTMSQMLFRRGEQISLNTFVALLDLMGDSSQR